MDGDRRLSKIRARRAEGSRTEAPLTPEYQAIFEANLKDVRKAAKALT
jgi:hypothetical protein